MKTTTPLFIMVVFFVLIASVSATWCDTDFTKRINVSVNNTGGGALTDYQVYVNLSANPINETSLRVYNSSDCTLRSHWTENETGGNSYDVWINYSSIAASTWTNNTAIYYDNNTASSVNNGTNTFEFFDSFGEGATINETYLTSWTKSGSNPLQSKTCQNWFISVYSNYSGEDKIYFFEQRDAHPSNNIECWSFTRANASTPANWTDHGVVFTASGAHDDGHIEPHGIIFETQSMSDAREGVGPGVGTPKWRLYYCAKGSGEAVSKYSANFIYASESDLTSWTAYSGNPVYDHDATWGFADSKVCIYNNKVWMHHCKYKTGTSCDPQFFSVSDNGIDNWTDKTTSWKSENTPIGTLVPFSSGILLTGRDGSYTEYNGYFTTDGDDKGTYSGNPILSGGSASAWDENMYWVTIVVDKNGSANLSGAGTYYMYYIGHTSTTNKLGLATSTTLTEESETTSDLDTNKWNSGGSPTISNGELLINAHGEYIRSVSTFQYKAMKTRVKFPATATSYHYFGFQASAVANCYNTESFFSYNTPDLKTLSGSATNVEATSIYNSAYFGSYHNYEILWKSGEAKFYVDESLKDTDTTDVCTVANPVGFYDYTDAGDLYVDWTLVRKYASPEPSSCLGSEEQQGTNPTLHIGNAINIKEDWGRDFNSNLSANVTTANASNVWMNFTNAEFTNTSLGDLNLTLNEWVNESHNVNAPLTIISVTVTLNSTTASAVNDTDSFSYMVTKRTNTATMDSPSVQNVDVLETFYVNATCNEEYSNTFLGAANLLEDGAIIDTDTSVTDYVNFSHSESSAGQYNYTIRFYNLTHYDNATTPTYSNVTVSTGEYIPPDATTLANSTGNFWVNHTWSMGTPGNITDSYNASIGVAWYNTTTVTYYNDSALSAHAWNNATVWAYNASGNGSLSTGSISDNVRIPNNPVALTVTQTYNKLETETVFISDTSSSDTDGDAPTYSCNRTDFFSDFSISTGYGNWTTTITDSGTYYVDIGVSDGWGSTDNKTLTITIGDATPGIPTGLANTTGNFWVNHTWSSGLNTDTFNVSANLSWTNSSANEHYNNTPLSAHKWSNVSVYGFNSTSGELSSDISQNTQIPNNVPVLSGLPDNTTDEDANQTDIFDLDDYFSDVDGDTPTYLVESNNQSAYVSVTINASNNVSYTLASKWNGTAAIVINVTDGWGGEDNDTFLIIVNAAPLPGDYTPGDPTTLQNTTGNYWVNYTWSVGGGNATDSYNVSWNLTWYNGTTDTFMKKEVGASNWGNITVYAFNSSGNGSHSAGYISDEVQAPACVPGDYEPPNPTTLQNITGNYYVNYTWSIGSGNITDSYNVSWNLSWFNGTLTTYMQKEVGASNWGNITVYAYNSSGNGTLSSGSLSDNVQAPAYIPGDYPPATPTSLANSTGNGWVNYTWASGGGANVTDSYNVSWNLTWYNNTLVAYMNDTVGEFGWANITVWAFNSSGNGSLSVGSISDETQAGGGTFTTSMGTTAYNLITYYGSATSTAEQFGLDIGSVDYIAMYNGSFYTHTMGFSANNFTTYHGIGYYVFLNASGSTTYQRNNIPDVPYNTQLFNRWNTMGWTNATNTNAEGVATSIGSACKYTSSLNADGITYTTHTVGFTSNNHAVEKGEGYWTWVNAGVNWGRNS